MSAPCVAATLIEDNRRYLQDRLDSLYFRLRNGEIEPDDAFWQEFKTAVDDLVRLNRTWRERVSAQAAVHPAVKLPPNAVVQARNTSTQLQVEPAARSESPSAPVAELKSKLTPESQPRSQPQFAPERDEQAEPAAYDAPQVFVGPLERLARGGYIQAGRQRIWVPEARISDLHLEHGMVVRAEMVGRFPNGKRRFFYSVVDRSTAYVNPNRDEVFGVVEPHNDLFAKLRTSDVTIFLSLNDLDQYGAVAGDVVKAAYLRNQVRCGTVHGYVLRRLSDTELEPALPGTGGGRRRSAVSRARPEGEPTEPTRPAISFRGSPKILVIGGRNWRWWEQGLIAHGAVEPEWLDGFRKSWDIEDSLSRYDIVIVVKPYLSHSLYERAKAYCIQHGKLFVSTSHENWSGFCEQVLEARLIPEWNQRRVAS